MGGGRAVGNGDVDATRMSILDIHNARCEGSRAWWLVDLLQLHFQVGAVELRHLFAANEESCGRIESQVEQLFTERGTTEAAFGAAVQRRPLLPSAKLSVLLSCECRRG